MTRRLALLLVLFAAPAQADDRLPIALPTEVREGFRAEMRDHMESLDDVLAALAEGDFAGAADVAELRMDFGNRLWGAMLEQGLSPEQVRALKDQRQAQNWQPGQGAGTGMGGGFGRYLPDDFRAMGMTMHEAAQAFGATARAVVPPADAEAYGRVLADLQFVTSTCRSCHATFRVE